jgi:cytidyltransferase-like protein
MADAIGLRGRTARATPLTLSWQTEPPPEGARPVIATGVFDLLHVGHLRFLEEARRAGAPLVVGVEDDARTRARKGPGRPLVGERERCELVAALTPVDAVFAIGGDPAVWNAPAYVELLGRLDPACIAFTQGDPAASGKRRTAGELGAAVLEAPLVDGFATSVLISKINQTFG